MFFDGFAENSGDGGVGGGIYNEDGGVVTYDTLLSPADQNNE